MCRPVSARPRSRTDTVAYPTFRWELRAARPIPGYPDALEHLGHHLLKRRLDLGLQQKQAAEILETGAWNLRNWESGRHGIHISYYPRIIQFLGYNPIPPAATRGQAVRRERLSRGWSRRQVGRQAGVDEATVRRIEDDRPGISRGHLARVLNALGVTRMA